jgi:hypothetical protein
MGESCFKGFVPEDFAPRIQSLNVEQSPARTLRVDFEAVNPFTNAITGLDLWLRVRARLSRGHILVAEGNFARFWTGEASPLYLYEPQGRIHIEARIPLPAAVLAEIESKRDGEVELEITGEVAYSIAHRPKAEMGHAYMGERRRIAFTPNGGNSIYHTIHQSEWLKLLNQLGWQDTELLEVPRLRDGPSKLTRAYQCLQAASRHFRDGHWDSSMSQCRKAYEAAMKDATGEADLKAAATILFQQATGKKQDALNALFISLGEYTHLSRHEGTDPLTFGRADAALCLFSTSAAVDYIANSMH